MILVANWDSRSPLCQSQDLTDDMVLVVGWDSFPVQGHHKRHGSSRRLGLFAGPTPALDIT